MHKSKNYLVPTDWWVTVDRQIRVVDNIGPLRKYETNF